MIDGYKDSDYVGIIKELCPDVNIVAIDYDPSATEINQENRIKLMLAVARERLEAAPQEKAPETAETPRETPAAAAALAQASA